MKCTPIKNNINFEAKIGEIPQISLHKAQTLLSDVKMKGYTAFIGGDVYTPSNKIVKQDLLFKDKKLVAIDEFDPDTIKDTINYVFLKDKTVAPAIIDQHIHGGYGVSFHDSSEAEIRGLLKKIGQEGTAGVSATTLPGRKDFIKNQIKVLNRIIKNPDEGAAKIYGIHLEGPFLSPKKAGIHPPEILLKPTIENYRALEPENVKIVTLAPELDDNYELSKYLKEQGVKVSAGHSTASRSQVEESGATQVTHLFNAMAGFHHRIPTIANAGLLNPKISAEMNTDLSLLDGGTMDLIMKQKPKDKVLLISDALPQAGLKEDFDMNGVKIHVQDDWSAISDDGILAGSMQFLHNVAKKLTEKTSLTFKDFIRYTSVNPSKNLGVEDSFRLQEGLSPSFSVWDNATIKPEKTFIG